MSASDNLNDRQFYHGSAHHFEIGQELTAEGARQANPAYPPHIRHVWAATKPLVAASHGTKLSTWDSGHVYQVEPLHPEDVELDPLGNGASVRSPSGFRVVRNIGSPAQLWDRRLTKDREAE
jgi:hypothetical protein